MGDNNWEIIIMYMQRYLLLLCCIVSLLTITVFSKDKLSEVSFEPTFTPVPTWLPTTDPYINDAMSEVWDHFVDWLVKYGEEQAREMTLKWLNGELKEPLRPKNIVKATGFNKGITVYFSNGMTMGFSATLDDSMGIQDLLIKLSTTQKSYVFVNQWGSKGENDGQFNCPTGLAVDSEGNIYVSDFYNYRIQKFDSAGKFITKWPVSSVNGQLFPPSSIAIDSKGYIYVGVVYVGSIQKFDSNGKFISKWEGKDCSDTLGEFDSPSNIIFDQEGNIWVTDYTALFRKFTPDGKFIRAWDTSNPKYQHCDQHVMEIAMDSSGYIYALYRVIPDSEVYNKNWPYTSYIQKFDPNGNLITQWGSYGSNDGEFKQDAGGIAVDAESNVYVADSWNGRIQKFDSNGKFLTKWGYHGNKDEKLYFPSDITIDKYGNAYVIDFGNYRMQKFTPKH
jgi:DNA-binding beta-propeller fold protein YncE